MNRTGATGQARATEPRPGVQAIKPFRRLWIALSLSSLGHWLSVPALTALAAALTRGEDPATRAQAIAGVLVLMVLPALLLGPLAWPAMARIDRRPAMAAVDGVRFALVLSVALVDAVPWTLAAAFLVAVASLLWTPVTVLSLPGLVPEDRREEARRSALRGAYGAAPVAAVVFALLALAGDALLGSGSRADLPVYAAAVVFLAAAGATFAIGDLPARGAHVPGAQRIAAVAPLKLLFQGQGRGQGQGEGRSGRDGGTGQARETAPDGMPIAGAHAAGAGAPAREPGGAHAATGAGASAGPVRGLALAGMVIALTAAAVVAAARLYAPDLGGGDAGYGSILAGLTAGAALGLFLGPRVLAPFSRRRLLGLAVIAAALALVPVALVQNLVVVVVLTGFLGLAAGVAWAVGTRLPEDEDRAFAYLRAVALLTGLIVVALVPPLAGLIGDHRLTLGDAVYDFGGAGATLLIAAVLAVPAGLVAFRKLDDRAGIPLVPDLSAALRGHTYVPPQEAVAGPGVVRDRGVFIAFEGGEGAGKTTQARLAAIWLRDHGYDVVATHEPGATKIGMRLRAMLLDQETTGLSPRAETLLYAADRADHVANVILPAMERGAIVVSDRYVDSSLAYQGYGRQQDVDAIGRVNAWATGGLVPDLTVLLEVPPETGLGRLASPADRIEAEPQEFHERVRQGFHALAEAHPERYLIVDAGRPQAEISREIQYRIREILPDPVPAGTEDVTSTFPAIKDL
ncbi:dTMP kinase [Actinomadura viridis]|uniref:dTMP kinase n=1 Tax=Actinomadura viridis TaxID=58110 RepID=UPI00367AC21E